MSDKTPTDALRLVLDLARKGAKTPGCNNWRAASMCRQIVEVLDKAAPASPPPGALPPISLDGPHEIDFHRQWLARQLLDSKLDDEEAYSIVRHDPAIKLPAAPTGAA